MSAARHLRVACLQLCAGIEPGPNLQEAERLLRAAKAQGAALAVLPENVVSMPPDAATRRRFAVAEAEHAAALRFAALAKELQLWLVAGSLAVADPMHGKLANRCLTFAPDGTLAARYDKIHLFDADPQPGERYRESDDFGAGAEAVLVQAAGARLGLTICYDLRFAALYRQLAQVGAEVLTIPAAFTQTTGAKHWHVLLRARAIETGCFVLAPAQAGLHENGRRTYGHSLIIDPDGAVLAEASGEGSAVITATLDLDQVAAARRAVPSLQHDRPFRAPECARTVVADGV